LGLIIELGGIRLAVGIAEKEGNGIFGVIFALGASTECVSAGAKVGSGDVLIVMVRFVGPIACLIHHGIVPHYLTQHSGNQAPIFLLKRRPRAPRY
jgi:hypothetical protein